jgi:hypothetical protein
MIGQPSGSWSTNKFLGTPIRRCSDVDTHHQ